MSLHNRGKKKKKKVTCPRKGETYFTKNEYKLSSLINTHTYAGCCIDSAWHPEISTPKKNPFCNYYFFDISKLFLFLESSSSVASSELSSSSLWRKAMHHKVLCSAKKLQTQNS